MPGFNHPLDSIRVAAPCPADWEGMVGSERVRYCGQCKLNVYNLSEMSRKEALALIEQMEGRLCVRFYRRADGTILTRNCPVGLSAIKRRLNRINRAVTSALLGFLAGLGLNAAFFGQENPAPRSMGATTGTMLVSREPERPPVVMGTTTNTNMARGVEVRGRVAVDDAGWISSGKRIGHKGERR